MVHDLYKMASRHRRERLSCTTIPPHILTEQAEQIPSPRNNSTLADMSSYFDQVEALVALRDCNNCELQSEIYEALTDALFFRLIAPEDSGPFIIVTEVAWCHGYYLVWKLRIPKSQEPDWPIEIDSDLREDAAEVFELAARELAEYQTGYRDDGYTTSIDGDRVTIFNDTFERVACLLSTAYLTISPEPVESLLYLLNPAGYLNIYDLGDAEF
ncbi:hypothetical protein M440DRAFT_355315 [Trichoderma longibrachiatum ATCC 18648]|uniref:Uncharacterized protein n=1 Tax=Trichoderma longibrachiatum ATCC 18648 TaxID=983965 RepID=A0A2T4C3U1_TRILO|nr:hypothetical protein M440DRAFT_355315 [Trichoderma longibrachiatum ATCC 18648]